MIHSRRSIYVVLLVALPLLAAATIVLQHYSRHTEDTQAEDTQTNAAQPEASGKPVQIITSGEAEFLRNWKPQGVQKSVLKLRRKKLKTLPTRIHAAGATFTAANTTYTLASGFDVNGFQYYQNKDATQFCQWSTCDYSWCLRASLIIDVPNSGPTAEYVSSGGQNYQKGPAGRYFYGGGLIPTYHATAPIVTAEAANNPRP